MTEKSEKPVKLKKDGTPDRRVNNGQKQGIRPPSATAIERKVIPLIAQGLPTEQIARAIPTAPCNVERIKKRWQPIFKQLANVSDYKDLRVNLLEAAEFEMLKSMLQDDKIQKASINNLGYAFQQIFNARRLESGQSTVNTSSQSFVKVDLSDCKS